ncbi:MAG: hypothetical protein LC667_01200 [Thioalkalivibrio sp.]|nr:hypothetical protein [Thioalkalivibrio sp.]
MPMTQEEINSVVKKSRDNAKRGHVPRLRSETDAQYEARKAKILAMERDRLR